MPDESAAAERQGAKLRPGTLLADRYCIESILGAGGFGVVWKARHVHLETECAIKLFDPPPGMDAADCGARFLQEARLMARLKCPHVVQVFDYGVHEGMPFLVLELLQGHTLARHLQLLRAGETRMSPAETARILRHAAEALQLAHAAQVVHRDLKPDNIFLVQEGETSVAKVLDFGIAKWSADTAPGMTTTRTVMGTAHYMSPEQFESARYVDHRADLWSLGVIAFECVTGQVPFPGDSFIEVAFKVCKEGPLIASQLAQVPAGFDAWFARATASGREDRFDSALEQAEALERVCAEPVALDPAPAASEPVPALAATLHLSASHAPSPAAAKPRQRRWGALGGACLLGVFAIWRVVFAGSQGAAAGPARDVTATVQAARPSSSEATAAPAGAPAPGSPVVTAAIPAAPAAAPSHGAAGAEDAAGAARPPSPAQSPSRAAKPASAVPKARPPAAGAPREVAKSDDAPSEGTGRDAERGMPNAPEGEADDAARPSVESPSAAGAAVLEPDMANITFDRQAAKAVLDAAAESARNCRPPGGLTGTGRVQVIFEPSGKVAAVKLLTSRFEDTETGSCVRMVFRRIRVPTFQGAPGIVVNKSFEIPEPGEPMFRLELPRRRP